MFGLGIAKILIVIAVGERGLPVVIFNTANPQVITAHMSFQKAKITVCIIVITTHGDIRVISVVKAFVNGAKGVIKHVALGASLPVP
jgi:hypothetical protein